MKRIPLPRHADMPQLILMWTIDEVVPFMVLFVIGILTDYVITCCLIGAGLTLAFRRFRDSKPDGFLLHYLYWHGLPVLKGTAAINPFQRWILP